MCWGGGAFFNNNNKFRIQLTVATAHMYTCIPTLFLHGFKTARLWRPLASICHQVQEWMELYLCSPQCLHSVDRGNYTFLPYHWTVYNILLFIPRNIKIIMWNMRFRTEWNLFTFCRSFSGISKTRDYI